MLSAFLESVGLKVLTTKNAFRLINFNVQTGTGRIINLIGIKKQISKTLCCTFWSYINADYI